MTSSNPPFRQPPKPDPVDAMLDEWRQIKAEGPPNQQAKKSGKWPVLSQLELMMLLLKRP